MGRLGGTIAAKQSRNSKAIAYAAGADGNLRRRTTFRSVRFPAHWSMEEVRLDARDDDVKFVGTMSDSGLFTPSRGTQSRTQKAIQQFPHQQLGRRVVAATYDASGGTPMKARSYWWSQSRSMSL